MAAKDTYGAELDSVKTILESLAPLNEEQRQFVLRTVMDRLNIVAPTDLGPAKTTSNNGSLEAPKAGSVTPKSFMKLKQPATGVEQLTCLAYYLTNYLDKPQFKTVELTKLNHEAGGQRISNPAVYARNAASQNGYLAPAGGGRKRLTNLGELVVEALPDRDKVKEVIAQNKKPSRRRKSASKT